MTIPKCTLKEAYLKKVDMRINYQQCRSIKPGNNIRINLNISKGFNRTEASLQEVELTMDLHAIEHERQFFQITLVQAGLFDIRASAQAEKKPGFVEMIETECSRTLFPLLKEAAVNLSQKSGFNHHFFDHVEFEQLLDPRETSSPQTTH